MQTEELFFFWVPMGRGRTADPKEDKKVWEKKGNTHC